MGSPLPSRRRRQTRLAFTPLPSSSPAAASYPSQIRERAAAVEYTGSPAAKKRKVVIAEGALEPMGGVGQDVEKTGEGKTIQTLPTPERSSQLRTHGRRLHIDDESASDGEPVRFTQRQSSQTTSASQAKFGRGGQRRLNFSQHTERSSSPATSSHLSINMAAPVKAQNRSTAGLFKGRNSKAIELSSNSSSDESLSEVRSPPPTQRSLRSKRQTQSGPTDDRESSPALTPEVTRSSQRPNKGKQTISISSNEDEDMDELGTSGGKPRAADQDTSDIHNIGEAEASGDDVILSPPAKRQRHAGESSVTTDGGKASVQDPIDHDEDTQDEDYLPLPSSIRGHRRGRSQQTPEEDDNDDIPATQGRRLRRKVPDASQKRTVEQEQEDLAEDLEFLGSSATQKSSGRLRSSAATPKTSARRTALELLKRRRAGQKAELPPSNDAALERPKQALYDTDSDSDGEAGAEDDPDEIDEEPVSAVHGDTAHDMFYADRYDQDFIVDDEEDTLGAPAELPLQFSSLSRAKSKDLFKYVVEWMVQKKINPAFASKDEVYDLAFRKLDDEVKGLAGSKFTSSAWTPDFTKALQARPRIDLTEISGPARTALLHHCDACNRRSHPATWDIRFYGKPYHEETLEEVSDDDDSEDSAASGTSEGGSGREPTYDSHGKEIPSEDRVFHVGQFCMRNARTAHALAHWRYHLNDWIVDYLRQENYTSPEKIVERDSWSTKKRSKYANAIADKMEESGEIRRLHHDFRVEIDAARNEKQAWNRRRR